MLIETIAAIEAELTLKNDARDLTLRRSRELIRYCAHAIRAAHRHEFDEAQRLLQTAQAAAAEMVTDLAVHQDLYYAGYTQDALKEVTEAFLVVAFVTAAPLPTPLDLHVVGATYLRGLAEATTELRRFALDLVRRGEVAEAERYLDIMDDVYSHLIALDYPDAITGGLRRHTDTVRGVLERTRGDLTVAVRQDQMRAALHSFEQRLGVNNLATAFSDVDFGADGEGQPEGNESHEPG
ncbi:MAG: haloacid dehalogenase [Anaerolineae bacterium]|jgi:translin